MKPKVESQKSKAKQFTFIPMRNYFPAFRLALSAQKLPKFDDHTPRYADKIAKPSEPPTINPKNRKAISHGHSFELLALRSSDWRERL